jgi:predicted TIM-barrel fold metal-dependent hydrolase
MKPYFDFTERDRAFYRHHIAPRLPLEIFDIHVHINLPEHVAMVPQERIRSDWALECGHILPAEDAYRILQELIPDTRHEIAGFPWPIREADLEANNAYLDGKGRDGKLSPFMCVKPDWPVDEIEKTLLDGDFVGFKPYPDMVSGVKGADLGIFDFLPNEQLELLNKYKKAVMLHLPRKKRFADDENIRELLEIRQKYPDISIIVAHFGRSFCPYYLESGLRKLGDPGGFYFDTSAVINPEVYDFAFSHISPESIIYGSDMPITLWHGRREWTQREYINLCRENFSWNKERRSPEIEVEYTLFLYEELRSLLDAVERHDLGDEGKKQIFSGNAKRALRLSTHRTQ